MTEIKTYPVERNLDGIYYRVERNERFKNICFSDLTEEERENVIEKYDVPALRRLSLYLAERIRQIGDELDLYVDE